MATLYGHAITNNGSNWHPAIEGSIFESGEVVRWGKGRAPGNRTGFVVAVLKSGTEMMLHIAHQFDAEAKELVAHYSKMLATPRSAGFDRMRPAINWEPLVRVG